MQTINARRSTNEWRGATVAAALGLAAAVGCGGGDQQMAPVNGTVSYQGRPLDHGQVVFMPDRATGGPPAVGRIDANGAFSMETAGEQGARIGAHRVTVHCRRQLSPEESKSLEIPESLIPDEYWKQELSPLRFDVAAGKNVYDITLD